MKKEQEKETIIGALIIGALVILFGVLAPSGDKNTPTPDIYQDTGKQYAWNELGKETIKAKLKDGDSAKFKDVFFHTHQLEDGKRMPITCGLVNSKNSFGGYTGYQKFIASGSVLSFLEEEVDDFNKVWSTFCY